MTDDRLDPEIRAFVEAVNADWQRHPPLASLSIAAARDVAEQVRGRWTSGGPIMAETRDIMVETGAGSLRVRRHRPVGVAENNAPALLYLHGGGFVFFSLETHDRLMREYAERGAFVVIGVDYPLSPEAKYPVALDHVVALFRWIAVHGSSIGLDPDRIAIGGARLDNAALLEKAGVTIAFSVSGNSIYLSLDAGIEMREGAGIAVANGLPYADALRAITTSPAAIWGIEHTGTLAPGADADVVIWDGDPLEPASAPVAVLVGGVETSLATRQTMLRARYSPLRRAEAMPPAYR